MGVFLPPKFLENKDFIPSPISRCALHPLPPILCKMSIFSICRGVPAPIPENHLVSTVVGTLLLSSVRENKPALVSYGTNRGPNSQQ